MGKGFSRTTRSSTEKDLWHPRPQKGKVWDGRDTQLLQAELSSDRPSWCGLTSTAELPPICSPVPWGLAPPVPASRCQEVHPGDKGLLW